jgi:extracellular factor (EF) 3-hydroxypalmitic acid methyl ester biosynthesis protein
MLEALRTDTSTCAPESHREAVTALLNLAGGKIRAGDADEGMALLSTTLRDIRLASDPSSWQEIVKLCLAHPIRALLHEDPLTGRSFNRPRARPVDAVVLDYIYSVDRLSAPPDMSRLGSLVWGHTVHSRPCEAVRRRRRRIALAIDQLSARKSAPRILSVAAGRFREAELSVALRLKDVEEAVALEEDRLSLALIARDYGSLPVTPVRGTVEQLIRGELILGDFDLVYAGDVLDYLPDSTAIALFRQMFDLTRQGGEVLVANALPAHAGVGYMEAYMAWTLVYRTVDELWELSRTVDAGFVDQVSIGEDGSGTIAYLSVRKR